MFLYRVICHILNQILEDVGMQEGVGGSEQRRNSPALKSAKEFTDSPLWELIPKLTACAFFTDFHE